MFNDVKQQNLVELTAGELLVIRIQSIFQKIDEDVFFQRGRYLVGRDVVNAHNTVTARHDLFIQNAAAASDIQHILARYHRGPCKMMA